MELILKHEIGIEVFWCEQNTGGELTIQSGRLAKYEVTQTDVYCMIEQPKMPGYLPRPYSIVSASPGEAQKMFYKAIVACKQKEIHRLEGQIEKLQEKTRG